MGLLNGLRHKAATRLFGEHLAHQLLQLFLPRYRFDAEDLR